VATKKMTYRYPTNMANKMLEKSFTTVQDCLDWANKLPDTPLPINRPSRLYINQVEQFQVIMRNGESYTIVVLVSTYHGSNGVTAHVQTS